MYTYLTYAASVKQQVKHSRSFEKSQFCFAVTNQFESNLGWGMGLSHKQQSIFP